MPSFLLWPTTSVEAGPPRQCQLIRIRLSIAWMGLCLVLGLPVHSVGQPAPEEVWTTDASAAVETATREDRDLLLLFTGSDWCPPCIELEKKILGKPAFRENVTDHFVPVKFDFPQETELPPKLREQNNEWSDRFGVASFPTIVLVDQELKPYAFTGFREEGPAEYLDHLAELKQARVQRDEFLSQAADATGLERARLLDQAMSVMDSSIVELYYSETVEEIGRLDEADEAGLRTKYFAERDREMRKAVMSRISMASRLLPPAEAVVTIQKELEENQLPVEMWLTAQSTVVRLLRKMDEIQRANDLIDQMIQVDGIDPESRQRLVTNKAWYLASLGRHEDGLDYLDQHIASSPENLLLTIAKGELLDSLDRFKEALAVYEKAEMAAAARPEIMVEVVGAKADALVALNRTPEALQILDDFANNEVYPGRLRSEAALHKALILRENGRRRAAMLSENKAIEIAETVEEKAEVQKLVDQFRRKFDSNVDGG